MDRFKEIIDKVSRMAVLSPSSLRLLELMRNEDHGLQDVVELVKCDAALTAHVLKVANSAAFSRGAPVTSLARAVSTLGEKMVVGIAVSVCMPGIYGKPLDGYEAGSGDLWRHSLCVAIASREMAGYAGSAVSRDVAYTAGILHDIGKAVLSEFLKGSTRGLIDKIDAGNAENFLSAERLELNMDHSEAGLRLAEKWGLPAVFLSVIAFHHYPAKAPPEFRLPTYLVHAADIITMMSGTGTGADTLLYPLDGRCEEYIDLSPSVLERIQLAVMLEYEKAKTIFFPYQ